MKIGISLPWLYMSERFEDSASRLLFETCGPPAACLRFLKTLGVSSVELRHFHRSMIPGEIQRAVRNAWSEDLEITVHGDLSLDDDGRDLFVTFPWAGHLFDGAEEGMRPLICTIHPLDSPEEDACSLRARTVSIMEALVESSARKGLDIHFAMELMRAKSTQKIWVTYEDITSLVEAVDHTRVGICWDMGHGFSNIRRGLLQRDVPKRFLKHVSHTHIHGLSPKGSTHWPLNPENLPLGSFIPLLAEKGYKGVYNLELSPERFKDAGDIRELIRESIGLLKASLNGKPEP